MAFFRTLKKHFTIELEGSYFFWYVLCYISHCKTIFRSAASMVFICQGVEKTWNCLCDKIWALARALPPEQRKKIEKIQKKIPPNTWPGPLQ